MTDRSDAWHIVLGDATCPIAVSSQGGRVAIPPNLGAELVKLIADAHEKGPWTIRRTPRP